MERLGRRMNKSRSRLSSDAVKEYVSRRGAEEVAKAIDRVWGELGHPRDKFVSCAAHRVLKRSDR
jgi:hypothetical protein